MKKDEHQWTKRGVQYHIEAKVGRVWVEHGSQRYQLVSQAKAAMQAVIGEHGLSGARICETKITHERTIVWEEKSGPELQVPKQMRSTGQKAACPACTRQAPEMTDGVFVWTFCKSCNAAKPVRSV